MSTRPGSKENPSRPTRIPGFQPRIPRPLAPNARPEQTPRSLGRQSSSDQAGRLAGVGRPHSATPLGRAATSAPTLRATPDQSARGRTLQPNPTYGYSNARALASPAPGAGRIRPRSTGAPVSPSPQQSLLTSVALRTRGAGRRSTAALTAVPVGPQAPVGTLPKPRQVIIPPGTINELETTIVNVPGSNALEQTQRITIPAGSVHPGKMTVVVVPPPRMISPPSSRREDVPPTVSRALEFHAEEERVREAKLAFASYLQGRSDPKAKRLRHKLLLEADPEYQFRFTEEEQRRAEDMWNASLRDIPDLDTSSDMAYGPPIPPPYLGAQQIPSTSRQDSNGFGHRFEQCYQEFGALPEMEFPESLYESGLDWDPDSEMPQEEQLVSLLPPEPAYQRRGSTSRRETLVDYWDSFFRQRETRNTQQGSYSAELFKLVRL